jgi:hypothetical protein
MGRASAITEVIRNVSTSECRLLSADSVTGPFDIIVVAEAPDLETLVREATDRIQAIQGVERTITCLS